MRRRKGSTGETYTAAGVDLGAAARALRHIRGQARSTLRPGVLSGIGLFAGLFELSGYREPVLVSSVDGVGTKLKIALALNKHDTVGRDLVHHCVNDILTHGAEPLFFLDYLAMGKLVPARVKSIVGGMASACRELGCTLIGGETAEMPGFYREGEYDLVGFIVGVVEKDRIIDGRSIEAGDAMVGLPSSGLHTNGYSLVRRVFGEDHSILNTYYPELRRTLGEELLEPHRCYYSQIKPVLPLIKGMAHITGGGLISNAPRPLPEGLAAVFDPESWSVPPIFGLIQRRGGVEELEMYKVFNMGVGMVLFCSSNNTEELFKSLPGARRIGEVVRGNGPERVVIG